MERRVDQRLDVVGREAELEALTAFLDNRASLPRGAIIEGAAGAGKTTLWRTAVQRATEVGYLVLTCRPTDTEFRLSLGGLSDLLGPHLQDALPALPAPQRRALEIAFLLRDETGRAADQRAVAAGSLNALRTLARDQAVLVAIDDAQWLDPESAEILEYALRRLGAAAVAVLASSRIDPAAADKAGQLRGIRLVSALEREPVRVQVGPLSLGAIHIPARVTTDRQRSKPVPHRDSGGLQGIRLRGASG